jgi:hypothetical protein
VDHWAQDVIFDDNQNILKLKSEVFKYLLKFASILDRYWKLGHQQQASTSPLGILSKDAIQP